MCLENIELPQKFQYADIFNLHKVLCKKKYQNLFAILPRFLYYKITFYTTKMAIFIAFKIDIKSSYSSKDIEMKLGTIKVCFFKKCKFYN